MKNIVSVSFPDPGGITFEDIEGFREAFPGLNIVIRAGGINFVLGEEE